MSEKEKLIQELIEGQKQFMSEINEHGHSESDYWLNKNQYRKHQEELAKQIHNDAHKQYLSEYESKSVVADITAGGSWLSEENTETLEKTNKEKS